MERKLNYEVKEMYKKSYSKKLFKLLKASHLSLQEL